MAGSRRLTCQLVMAAMALAAVQQHAPMAHAQQCQGAAATKRKLLMIPGPVEFHEDVMAAAGGPAMAHYDAEFIEQFGETIELLRKVFFTETAQPFVVPGSGSLGWDMVAANLLEAGEHALVINTGYFGDKFAEAIEAYGAVATHLLAPLGGVPTLQEVEDALAAAPPGGYKVVTITHVDTSTGVLTDVQAISEVIRAKSPDTLVVVDGVCSIGAEDLKMDAWGVDAVLTGSQKALGSPPGLSITIASQRALKVMEGRKTPIPSYYASWKRWLPVMRNYEQRKPGYFATPAVQLVQALRVSLRQMLAETPNLEDRFAVHAEISGWVKGVLKGWGLKLVPTGDVHSAHTMTAAYLPDGVTLPEFLPKVTSYGVMIGSGVHKDIAPKYFRIGHMGISAMHEDNRGHVDRTLAAIRQALIDVGYTLPGTTGGSQQHSEL